MKYDFDRIVDRKSTYDMKWHSKAVESYLHCEIPKDMIPMWLADTDFACAPVIVEAVKKRAEKEIYGYCAPMADFYKGICYWQKFRFDWDVKPEWISYTPTVVASINIAIRAFTKEGNGIIIQQPVYDPFATIVKNTGRVVVNNGLIKKDGKFQMNLEELEELAAKPDNTMMVLCSPHNPVGRVWTKEELCAVAEICLKHDVMLVSDEIHSDIVYEGHRHFPILTLDARYADHFIHLTAPGKTFNVAGLKVSAAIIPNEEIRLRFAKMQIAMSLDVRNTFGIECITAAYSPEGAEWVRQEVQYLQENVDFLEDYLKTQMPEVTMIRPEGTFLCWLDFSKLGLGDAELFRRFIYEAGVICVQGPWFGPGGEDHMRLNIGCPRSMLKEALDRIRCAVYA